MNLLLAICLGICIAPDAGTPEQRAAAELLPILEYLGGIEDESKWEELLRTLGHAKVDAEAAAGAAPEEAADVAAEEPEGGARRNLELVEVVPSTEKNSALCADRESC